MLRVACLPGDGIGPEVTSVAIEVLRALPIEIEVEEHSFGGGAILAEGTPLPERTLAACQAADAVILGAVGLPQLEGAPVRPEQGLIGLRKALDVYANLRPATGPGIDLLIVRELVGGLYYGASGRRPDGSAFDTCEYTPEAIERIARRAFELAGARRAHVTSVDKVNVLETSRLWRETVVRVAADYPDVELEHMLVDTAGMKLVQSPRAVRRDPDREHVRRHPLRRRSRHVRRARARGVSEPRRQQARHLRAGARLRPRHRREGNRQPRGDAPLGGAAAPARRRRAGPRDVARERGRSRAGETPPVDQGGSATTADFTARCSSSWRPR